MSEIDLCAVIAKHEYPHATPLQVDSLKHDLSMAKTFNRKLEIICNFIDDVHNTSDFPKLRRANNAMMSAIATNYNDVGKNLI